MSEKKRIAFLFARYKLSEISLKRMAKSVHNTYVTELGQSVKRNPKTFWSFVKSRTGNSNMPNVIKWDQCEAGV